MTEKIGHQDQLTSAISTGAVGQSMSYKNQQRTQFQRFNQAAGFQRLHLFLFIVLSLLLLGVLFLLPGTVVITEPQAITANAEQPETVQTTPDSPWSDAQLAKQRREAQEVLSKILDIQEKLENKKVELWAQAGFQQAMDTAANGDVEYRQRSFTKAQENYRQSLHLFEALIAQVDGVYDQQMTQGQQAIDNSQPQQAITSYQLALYLKADSQEAQQGLKRAKAQDEVIALVQSGSQLMKRKDLSKAKQTFEQALSLDPASQPAKDQLIKVKLLIIDDNFTQSMSAGFKALNQQQFVQAIAAFKRATKIKPAAADAAESLVQAKNRYVQAQIAAHFEQATSHEQSEQWHSANKLYREILKLDKSVIKARVGDIRSGVRAKLDDDLIKTLEQPQRLASASVYREGQAYYRDGKSIKNPGPKLTGQLSQLSQLLTSVKVPVPVQLKSDNQTTVTLYKVGELGSFTAKNMDLKPGKYTLIGTRNGYRDIRREFTLMPNSQITTIVVQCEEKIRL